MKRLIYILLITFTAILNCSNLSGMPRRIQFSAGHTTEYLYDADGRKLRTVHRMAMPNMSVSLNGTVELDASNTLGADSTDYVGSFILRQGQLDKYLFDGGYVTFSGSTPQFHYYGKDHLGNNRTVVNSNGTLEQVTHYYAFGGLMGESTGGDVQDFKYNGKELDRLHGLDWFDYEARHMDAVRGVFITMDPLCEKYYDISPYAYCANNPIKFIDPDGRKTYLYATTLPGIPHNKLTNIPTHTFIVVKDDKNIVKGYYAYGPKENGAISGPLKQREYNQDVDIIKGKDNDNLKNVIPIDTPEGMTDEQFDQRVIDVAESFGNNDKIMYSILPNGDTQGNCNTSTSTILLKAGISEDKIDKIKEQIPGLSTGFCSTAKPWTSEEQNSALQTKNFMDWSDSLLKTK